MRRVPVISRAVFLGLLVTHLLATLHVYLSNQHLHHSLVAVSQAGYLAVPNEHIMRKLCDIGTAFLGGVFFTLTVGAGLSIFSAAIGWTWISLLQKNRPVIGIVTTLWIGLTILINSRGLSALVTSYFLFIPPIVFLVTVRWADKPRSDRSRLHRLAPVLVLVLLTIVWASLADRLLFMNIRDYLLLSNPVGRAVDRFYYRYTLYPAQVFKPLEQKTLKTCSLAGFDESPRHQRARNMLERHDYLPISKHAVPDLKVVAEDGAMVFKNGDQAVLKTSLTDFLSRPYQHLSRFSAAIDIYGPFRQATFVCLLVGFPVLLYMLVFSLVYWITSFACRQARWSLVASGACLMIGLGLLAAVYGGRAAVSPETLPAALESNSWRRRTDGLRLIVQKGLEIGNYPYHESLTSPHVPERYWLTKAIGLSRAPETIPDILTLLEDPHPNVVSMAFQAAGNRGTADWVPEIINRIKTSKHWYNQWYAYRALKSLGWHQGLINS